MMLGVTSYEEAWRMTVPDVDGLIASRERIQKKSTEDRPDSGRLDRETVRRLKSALESAPDKIVIDGRVQGRGADGGSTP